METINKANCKEATILDLMNRINQLEKENRELKTQNAELLLHSEIKVEDRTKDDIGMMNEYEKEYLAGCENEEDLKAYENAYGDISLPEE